MFCEKRVSCDQKQNTMILDIVNDDGRGVGVLRAYPCQFSALFFVDMVVDGMGGVSGAVYTNNFSILPSRIPNNR